MATSILKDLVAANGSFRNRVLPAEEAAEYDAGVAALTAEAKENWGNAQWHHEQAAIIAESLDVGFRNDNVFQEYMPTSFLPEDGKLVIEERRGLKVFYTHRAGEIDESTIRTERWELPRDTLGWHVSEFEDDVRNNYGPTVAELIPMGRMREQAEINRRIFSLVQEAIPEGHTSYEDATTTFDRTVLNTAIAEVSDVPPPSNVSIARPVTIVGRAAALNEVYDFPGYAPEAQEELRKTGRLGIYRGANIIQLTNWVDEDNVSFIPDDELYVFGGYAGRFALYGGPRVKMWNEDKVDFTHFRSRRDIGGAVYHPEAVRRIKLG